MNINIAMVIGDLTHELHIFINGETYDHYRIPTLLNDTRLKYLRQTRPCLRKLTD